MKKTFSFLLLPLVLCLSTITILADGEVGQGGRQNCDDGYHSENGVCVPDGGNFRSSNNTSEISLIDKFKIVITQVLTTVK